MPAAVTLLVQRRDCGHDKSKCLSKCCLDRVQEALRQVTGVTSVATDPELAHQFVVEVDDAQFVTLKILATAVTDLGNYECTSSGVVERLLQISGIQGPADLTRVLQSLKDVQGVEYAAVDSDSHVAVVWTLTEGPAVPISKLQEAVQSCSKVSIGQLLGGVLSAVYSSSQDSSGSRLQVEPKGVPKEQELLLRMGSLNTKSSMQDLVSSELLEELEAVPGVMAVEPVQPQQDNPRVKVREVKVFYNAEQPVSLEMLQTAAVKCGAQGAEVIGSKHALADVHFGDIAEHMNGDVSQIVLTVRGMSSRRCVSVVRQSLERVNGVLEVTVPGPEPIGTCPSEGSNSTPPPCQQADRKVLVSLTPGCTVTPDILREVVEQWAPHCCGRVQPTIPGASQVLISLTGVDTKAKAQTLSAALAEVPGVVFESISMAQQEAIVIGQPSLDLLLEAVTTAGYSAQVSEVLSKPLPKPEPPEAQGSEQLGLSKGIFRVVGMTCSSCSSAVERSLNSLTGVRSAQVNLLTEKAVVEFDSNVVSPDQIIEEIEDTGFEASLQEEMMEGSTPSMVTARLTVGDMSCTSCANAVESILKSQPGVKSASVNFAISKATVQFDSSQTGLRSLAEAVEEGGYSATPESWDLTGRDDSSAALSESRKWALLFWWAFLCAFPIAIITMGLHHLHLAGRALSMAVLPGLSVENAICLTLSSLSQLGAPGLKFYRDSWHGLRRCAPNMALLVALGTTVSYLYGLYGVVLGLMQGKPSHWADDYFEVAADLIAFITFGKWLEARAKGATSMVLHKLLDLKPKTATLLTVNDDGQVVKEREIPAEQLQVGDLLKVVRGTAVPADGIVVVGTAEVDESMLTGESMPVTKSVNDKLMGATVVKEGTVFLRVTSAGADTVLHQIVRMIEDAQASKPPIQALADAISRVFVPTIVAISFTVFCLWLLAAVTGTVPAAWMGSRTPLAFALNMGIATMVVACPCAMGLAVPTAIMVGTGVAARNGVLIKEGEAIEHARKVTAIIFDKTGTLTEGKPQVTDAIKLGTKYPLLEIVRLTGAAETNSEHPLGRALVTYAQSSVSNSKGPQAGAANDEDVFLGTPSEFEATSGKGLHCKVEGRHILVGTRLWMEENKVKGVSEEVHAAAGELEAQAKTAVLVAIDLQVAAVFGVADAPRPESRALLSKLNSMGILAWMVTGDNRTTANSVAEKLGLSEEFVMAEVMPGNKARQVKRLQDEGHIVAMVGDGINDAPALAQADLGLAIGNGTDIAIEAAGMVLMGAQISGVLAAIDVSRAIHNRIWMNFGWAFVYNLVLIPAAAGATFPIIGATLPAWAAGAAMAMSSVSVVLSSLLLNLYRAPTLSASGASTHAAAPALLQSIVVDSTDHLTEPLLQSSVSSSADSAS